ncbi:hypothetical protein HA402_006424 [Bradysia odoriphaga]|nr:hypothetical protein HA402_006424 [Bradysia odoriphaga]
MNSKFNLISVGVVINLIKIFNVSTVNANLLDSIVYYNDSEIREWGFSNKDMFNLHHSFVIEQSKWKDGQINFKIDKNFNDDEIDKILEAMYNIELFSCVRFAAHDPRYGPDYVMIEKDYTDRFTSSAELGCVHEGKQALSLSVHMIDDHQTILHELFHTIGFGHHHQRSDRDNYIEIHYENTNLSDSDYLTNFAPKVSFDPRITYWTPFDFNSIMLYDEDTFSANNKSVITSKIKGSTIPSHIERNRGLSPYDVVLLNRFYDCNTVDKRKSKIFYETAVGMLYPKIVNFHEIQRAKDYFVLNVPRDVEQNQTGEELDDANDSVDHEADKYEVEDEVEVYDNEEDYIVKESQTDGQLQDGQNTDLTSSVVDRLRDESRIDENLLDDDEKLKIFLAMKEIEKSSCIRFVHHDPSHNVSDYVMIMKDYTDRSSSSSDLGCLHLEKQFVWLGADMFHDSDIHDTILHEILHTIGFDHHHQRSDRDTYIAIHLENTNLSDADILADYAKRIKFNPWLKYATPFDFDSVMLYEAYSDSVNDKAVITSKINGKRVPVYREQGLSKNDKILLNRFYDCDGTGSRHPRVISYKEMYNYRMFKS